MTASLPNEIPDETPAAVQSERAVLSACLYSRDAMVEAMALLSDDDWWWPVHADLWRVMRTLHESGVVVEPQAVYGEARKLGPNHLDVLTGLATAGMHAGSVGYHCGLITQASQLRHLQAVIRRGWQMATGTDVEPVGAAEDIIEQLRIAQRMQTEESTQVDFLDLVKRRQTPPNWVIPGLMGRRNRMILTAPEGYGKSTLLRQIAVTSAAGLQPFHPEEAHEPRRVYVLDAENPEDINTAEYGQIYDFLDQYGMLPGPNQLIVDEVGANYNLLDPRNAAAVLSRIDRFRPDLILAGPIYQLHDENPNDEGPARKLSGVFDRMVGVANSALITEAHTPHSDGPQGQLMRPYGASLWKRWPEFGFCLHPLQLDRDVSQEAREISAKMRESRFSEWRGQRGRDRHWPRFLSVGGRLPWEEHTPLKF